MKGLDSLKVEAFTRGHVPNQYPGGMLPWQVYHAVRNCIVETCRKYGPTGPMGVIKIVADVENPILMLADDPSFWERGDPEPTYFVLDDQPNHERYCYAELHGSDPLSAGWLLSITAKLRQFEGWGLGVSNIPDSYLIIFGNKLMVKGRLARCKSAREVVETTRKLLQDGKKRWWHFWR